MHYAEYILNERPYRKVLAHEVAQYENVNNFFKKVFVKVKRWRST